MVLGSSEMYPNTIDSYSYRLWSLANIWTYQMPLPNTSTLLKEATLPLSSAHDSVDSDFPLSPLTAGVGGAYFKCPACCQAFTSPHHMKEHLEACPESAGASSLLLPCLQCSAVFSSRDQLEKHELLHSPNSQVSCKLCNKTFANVYRLQRHMISHDESALLRKFKCTQCEKAFKFKHHLKEHLRIHSGEKPFECCNCGKRFSHSGSYSSHMTSKKCLIMNLKINNQRTNPLNNNTSLTNGNTMIHKQPIVQQLSRSNKRSGNINNNNYLSKYSVDASSTSATAAFLANLQQNHPSVASSLHPYFLQNGLNIASAHHDANGNAPYFHNTLTHLLEQLNHSTRQLTKPPPSDISEDRDEEEIDVTIKEVKEEELHEEDEKIDVDDMENEKKTNCDSRSEPEDEFSNEKENQVKNEPEEPNSEEPKSPSLNETSRIEAMKMILNSVSSNGPQQMLSASMASCSSGCQSSAPSPSMEVESDALSCKYCSKSFTSGIDLHQHERYICHSNENKHERLATSEGLASRLEDAIKNNEELSYCSNSDDGASKTDLMTEDEDGELDQDGNKKVRVRSQIAEEQLSMLKTFYAINPRPKKEELLRIADKVGFNIRVVQVWFQNNRARDRREGKLVHVPYQPYAAAVPSEQPLDLSTKKSTTSTPAGSPQRHSDSDDYVAVNLSKSSPSFIRPKFHSFSSSDYTRSPSPIDNSSRIASMLSQQLLRIPPNGSSLGFLYNGSELHTSTSHSPLPGMMMQHNGNASPGSAKRSWKQSFAELSDMGSLEGDESLEDRLDDDSGERKLKTRFPLPNGTPVPDDNSAEGQFFCDQCDKVFSKHSSLARHKYEHSGQRPYKCLECPKAFKHKHHLTEHKRLHSGEKPFQCCKCLKRFSHSGSYSQHMNHRYSYCKPYRE